MFCDSMNFFLPCFSLFCCFIPLKQSFTKAVSRVLVAHSIIYFQELKMNFLTDCWLRPTNLNQIPGRKQIYWRSSGATFRSKPRLLLTLSKLQLHLTGSSKLPTKACLSVQPFLVLLYFTTKKGFLNLILSSNNL